MKCSNCGEEGAHYVCPGGGDPGFYACNPKGVCHTCNGKKGIENSSSGISMGGPVMVPCPTCNGQQEEQEKLEKTESPFTVEVNRFMFFLVHDFMINLSEKAAEIACENGPIQRTFLHEEYQDLEMIYQLYMTQLECGKDKFSWRYLIDNGKLSLYALGHFKGDILKEGVSEEEWQKEVEENYKNIGEEKVKEYLKGCEEYVMRHTKYRKFLDRHKKET